MQHDVGINQMTKDQCLQLTEFMIAEAKRNIARSTRTEDARMWHELSSAWQQRLDSGEDPCSIYLDIFNTSTKI